MYRILALEPWYGWAILAESLDDHDETLWLLRPPYRAEDLLKAHAATLERAVRDGIRPGPEDLFDRLGDVIAYLDDRVSRENPDSADMSLEDVAELWDAYSPDMLDGALLDLEGRVLDADPRRTSRYLALLLGRPPVRADPEFVKRLSQMLVGVLAATSLPSRPPTPAREAALRTAGGVGDLLDVFLREAEARRSLFKMVD